MTWKSTCYSNFWDCLLLVFFSYTKIISHKLILSIAVFRFEHVVKKCSPLSIFLKKWRLEISNRGPIGNLIAKSFWNYLPHAQFRLLLLQNLSLESIFSKKKLTFLTLKIFRIFHLFTLWLEEHFFLIMLPSISLCSKSYGGEK